MHKAVQTASEWCIMPPVKESLKGIQEPIHDLGDLKAKSDAILGSQTTTNIPGYNEVEKAMYTITGTDTAYRTAIYLLSLLANDAQKYRLAKPLNVPVSTEQIAANDAWQYYMKRTTVDAVSHKLAAHEGKLKGISFSSNDKWIAEARGNTVRVYDLSLIHI